MNEAAVIMWYDNSVLMTFLGVIVGGVIGFIGSIIQSHIAAKNSIDVVKAQSENEIEQHRYMEKEKLYTELISFIPHFIMSINIPGRRCTLSTEDKVQFNSFKARISIYSNNTIYEEFYELAQQILQKGDSDDITKRMDAFTEMLLEDLRQPIKKGKQKKKTSGKDESKESAAE